MPNLTISQSVSGAGISLAGQAIRSADSVSGLTPTLPAGKAGTLSGRTDNDTGVATLSGGHGIVTSDVVDVYWSGGRRYGMDATVSSNDVTIDGGSGDNLPSTSTAVVVTKQVTINVSIDGDELAALAIQLAFSSLTDTSKGHVGFYDAGDASIAEVDLTANQIQVFDIEGGATNVFTGNPITYLLASNGSSDDDATLNITLAQDSTP